MAVAKRYCVEDAVINNTVNTPLYVDTVRTNVYNAVFSSSEVSAAVTKILNLKKIGKDTSCDIEKLFYLQMLAEYFQIIKEDTVCGSATEFEDLKTNYKLDCIRNILTCRYGLGNIIEELVELLGLRTPYNGIGYMTISLDTCELFTVYGARS